MLLQCQSMAETQEPKLDLLPSYRDGIDNWRECPQFAHPIHPKVEIECYMIRLDEGN